VLNEPSRGHFFSIRVSFDQCALINCRRLHPSDVFYFKDIDGWIPRIYWNFCTSLKFGKKFNWTLHCWEEINETNRKMFQLFPKKALPFIKNFDYGHRTWLWRNNSADMIRAIWDHQSIRRGQMKTKLLPNGHRWAPIALMEPNSHPFTAFGFGHVYETNSRHFRQDSTIDNRFLLATRVRNERFHRMSRRMHWAFLLVAAPVNYFIFHVHSLDLSSGDVSPKQSETLMSKLNVSREMNVQVAQRSTGRPLDLNGMFCNTKWPSTPKNEQIVT
jgi:hypothetical protein